MDDNKLQDVQEELRKTRQELLLLYEIGNLIRTTLLLDEVMYLILSAVTSHEGLRYNRAILFMVDDSGTQLEGAMGIGPTHPDVSPAVWKMIEENKITLEGLLDVYHKAGKKIDVELNQIVRQIRLPIEKSFGILAKTVINDAAVVVSKEDSRHELSDMRLINLGISEFAVFPLHGKDHVIGVLMIDNVTTRKPLTQADIRRVTMLANHAGLALENAKTYNQALLTSQQDYLTQLWNHGYFQKALEECVFEAKSKKRYLSVVLFDVDNFKEYNDTFGHPAGDRALEGISQIAKTVVRRIDFLARYGGEEFAAILPDTTRDESIRMAERLRETIEKETEKKKPGTFLKKITVSLGVSSFPDDASDKDKLLYCADAALYEAKRAGKNCVKSYQKPDPSGR